jgi:4-phytase / acid phosphatase
MKRHFARILLALIATGWGVANIRAQNVPSGTTPGEEKLEYVVYLSRHGVRSPTSSNATLNAYAVDPFPDWGIPVGYLSAHGRWLMQLMGVYDREYFTQAGLLAPKSCTDANRFYFWSDTDERDIETGRALAYSMFPDCKPPIHSYRTDLKDPLFAPAAAGLKKPDRVLEAAAVGGRMGDNPRSIYGAHSADVELMQRVLSGCDASGPCPRNGRVPKRMVLSDPPPPAAGDPPRDRLAQLTSILSQTNAVAEAFFLEYVDGMDMKDVGWGRIDENDISRMMALRAVSLATNLRAPYVAKAQVSNLLSHMLRSMVQKVDGKQLVGSLGHADDKALIILGHDGDIYPLSTVLGISWIAEGYAPNEAPPGCAIVFEIWRDAATGKRRVRTYLLSETPKLMRAAAPLSLRTPPTKTLLFIPGCSTAGEGYPCDWDAFRTVAANAIDVEYVAKEPPAAEVVR